MEYASSFHVARRGSIWNYDYLLDQCLMTGAHKGQEEVVVGWGIMSLEDQSKEDHKRCNQYAKAEHRAEGGGGGGGGGGTCHMCVSMGGCLCVVCKDVYVCVCVFACVQIHYSFRVPSILNPYQPMTANPS